MQRVLALAVLPLILHALEKVNLIKDAGFEKDSDAWLMRSEATGVYDSSIISRHDPDSALMGSYCGTVDELIKPGSSLWPRYNTIGVLYQMPLIPKQLQDLDSIKLFHMCIFATPKNKYSVWDYAIKLKLTSPSSGDHVLVWYLWISGSPIDEDRYNKIFPDTVNDEGMWNMFKRDLKLDLIERKGLPDDATLDTFLLSVCGCYYLDFWYGEKTFFDDIRLTGYADYDVGVKEILSGDSVWEGVYYKPVARIKSFGRQAADDFLAIAEMRQGKTLVWADTIPYTLPADTEDTLEFDSFPIPDALNYTLTVRTEMSPDESDEDDELSKPLHGTGIAEQPGSQVVTLEVQSFSANPRVLYSLPQCQSGTISIYDASGRKLESRTVKGSGEVGLPLALSSDVYFVRLEAGSSAITRKAVIK